MTDQLDSLTALSCCSPVVFCCVLCCGVVCCRETRELERQLRVLQRSSGGSEKAIFALRKTIRHHYRQVIYLDLAFAAENEVEQVNTTQHNTTLAHTHSTRSTHSDITRCNVPAPTHSLNHSLTHSVSLLCTTRCVCCVGSVEVCVLQADRGAAQDAATIRSEPVSGQQCNYWWR